MRDNIIITGIKEQENENLPNKVYQLLEEIGVDSQNGNTGPISFDRMHRFGSKLANGTRPIVAKVHDYRDKSWIMDCAPGLKDINAKAKAEDEKGDKPTPPIFINDQYPDEISEKRKQAFAKIRENKRRPTLEQSNMKLSLDKLYINGELDKPAVTRPSVSSLMNTAEDEKEKLSKIKFAVGDRQSEKGNSFTGVSVKVNSLADVRRAYKKLLQIPNHAAAAHVMVAYMLEDNTVGNFDDGEHGGGYRIQRSIQDTNIRNTAVFVIRHHPSINYRLGPSRFNHIAEATKSALQALH